MRHGVVLLTVVSHLLLSAATREPWLLQGTRVQFNALPREATRQAASVGYVGRTLQASRAPPPPPPPPPPDNVRLTVLSTSSSTGPEAMGVNLGHKHPDSNWKLFFSRMKPSFSRLFFDTPGRAYNWTNGFNGTNYTDGTNGTGRWGLDLNGAPVSSEATFRDALSQQRSYNGRDPDYQGWDNPTLWDWYEQSLASPKRYLGSENDTASQLQEMGVKLLVVIATTCRTYAFASMDSSNATFWAERWELYRHVYALASWCYKRGVRHFELYNEPQGDDCLQAWGPTPEVWMHHYYLRAMAIRNAFEDWNQGVSSPIQPFILASAFARSTYGGAGTYSWSRLTVLNRKQTFPDNLSNINFTAYNMSLVTGGSDGSGSSDSSSGGDGGDDEGSSVPASNSDGSELLPFDIIRSVNAAVDVPGNSSWSNMDAYSFHSYAKTGSALKSQYSQIMLGVKGDWPTTPAMWVTEHNALTNAVWIKKACSTDSAKESTMAAAQAMGLASVGGNSMLFKFSVTPAGSALAKNGVHWADSTTYPYNIADATLAAEAARLVNTHLSSGSVPLLDNVALPASSDRLFLAVRKGSVFYLLMHLGDTATGSSVSIDTSAWGILPGTQVVVQQVSSQVWGEVPQLLTVGAAGIVTKYLPPNSLALLAFPTGIQTQAVIPASVSASVAAGDLSGRVFPSSQGLQVATSRTSAQEGTSVSLLRFDVPAAAAAGAGAGAQVAMDRLTSAVLELTVSGTRGGSVTSSDMVMLVLAVYEDAWNASSASWQTTAALNPLFSNMTINTTASNFINWSAVWAVAGHVSVPVNVAAGTVRRLDITDVVRSVASKAVAAGAQSGSLSLLIYRPFRTDPSPSIKINGDDLSGGCVVSFAGAQAATTAAPKLLLFGN